MCRSRRELSNAHLLAKIGVDTAENEPCKVCPLSAYRSPRYYQIAVRELCSLETASGSLLRHSPFLGSAVVSTPLQYPGAPSMIAVVSTETYNALTLQWTPAVLNDCTFVETEVQLR